MFRVCGGLAVFGAWLTLLGCGSSDGSGANTAGAAGASSAGAQGLADDQGNGSAGNANAGGSGSGGSSNGGSAGSAQDGPDPTSKAGACVMYSTAYCLRVAYCRGDGGQCTGYADACPDPVFSEGSTRTVEGMVACAKELRGFPCEDLAAGKLPSCVTPGTKALGEPCKYASQCASGSCGARDFDECGHCVPDIMPGEMCDEEHACPGVLTCEAGTCSSGFFGPLMPSCGSVDCTGATYCNADQKCVPLPGVGEPCQGDTIGYCNYEQLLYCASDQTCQPAPKNGMPCGERFGGGFDCAEGYCNSPETNPVCMPLPVEGEACTVPNLRCAPDHHCVSYDGVTGICYPITGKGSACVSSVTCDEGLSCDQSICKSSALPEASCADGSTLCHPASVCDGSICQPADLRGSFEETCAL